MTIFRLGNRKSMDFWGKRTKSIKISDFNHSAKPSPYQNYLHATTSAPCILRVKSSIPRVKRPSKAFWFSSVICYPWSASEDWTQKSKVLSFFSESQRAEGRRYCRWNLRQCLLLTTVESRTRVESQLKVQH